MNRERRDVSSLVIRTVVDNVRARYKSILGRPVPCFFKRFRENLRVNLAVVRGRPMTSERVLALPPL